MAGQLIICLSGEYPSRRDIWKREIMFPTTHLYGNAMSINHILNRIPLGSISFRVWCCTECILHWFRVVEFWPSSFLLIPFQFPAGVILSGALRVLHHKRVWEEFWRRFVHTGTCVAGFSTVEERSTCFELADWSFSVWWFLTSLCCSLRRPTAADLIFWLAALTVCYLPVCYIIFFLCIFPGNCDHRGFWCGVHRQNLVSRMLLQVQGMERPAEICPQAVLRHRWVSGKWCTEMSLPLCITKLHPEFPFSLHIPAVIPAYSTSSITL